jgi:nijmegen breakage syndrome protein 1
MGAYATEKWMSECTHLVVEDSSPITNDVMEAIMAKKPIVVYDWIQAMVGQTSLPSEIPSCLSFPPTMTLKCGQVSVQVKVADPKCRETCLCGVTFVVGPLHLYHYKEKLQFLLEVAGATVIPFGKRCSSTQKSTMSGNSFNDLIPFGRDPYKEADYGREMVEFIKEEKKRKEAEALAEDLFNAERVKRQRGGRHY